MGIFRELSNFYPQLQLCMKKVPIHRLKTNMAELRNFGCCFDNFKASKIIHNVFLMIDGIMVITGPILQVIPFLRNRGDDWPLIYIGAIGAIFFAIYMIVDALLLAGSIKRNKVALAVGLVLSGIVILGLVVITFWSVITSFYVFIVIPFTLLTIGLRLWTFLIGVQCYRSIGVGTLPQFELLEN